MCHNQQNITSCCTGRFGLGTVFEKDSKTAPIPIASEQGVGKREKRKLFLKLFHFFNRYWIDNQFWEL